MSWEERRRLIEQSDTKKIEIVGERQAYYGSLRAGQYNSRAASNPNYVHTNTVTIKGFKLYSKGAYPAAVRSDSKKDTMVVDLFDISDVNSIVQIYNMEIGAGYNLEHIKVNGNNYAIYLFDKGWENNRPVSSGDWVDYLNQPVEAVS